tara:strand:- start:175 stop:1035 length:861 start_codon:yes stop_codon:yes gene_type:complete
MLDFTNNENGSHLKLPKQLDFDVSFEPTRVVDQKYAINEKTGEPFAIVGKGFACVTHRQFFNGVWDQITENLAPSDLKGAAISFQSGRYGGFGMIDIQFPAINKKIETDTGHTTEVRQRIIGMHGVDGKTSNVALFGSIDTFCTNGQISGEHSKIRRKNTSGFSLGNFINELRRAKNDFYLESERLQVFADTSLKTVNVRQLLEDIIPSVQKSKKMYDLYQHEAATRGHNKFSLMSAFTNYASHTLGNGFELRNTSNRAETEAITMVSRENEVNKWMSDHRFLEAA